MIHDIIKIKYSREGYLPEYPPHLISDYEMCKAFMYAPDGSQRETLDWFHTMYPKPQGYDREYRELELGLSRAINAYLDNVDVDKQLPSWVYAYMLGAVIGPNSDLVDRHNILVLLNADNVDDEFNSLAYHECYRISQLWLARYSEDRPPSMFAEPHVVKYCRLRAAE